MAVLLFPLGLLLLVVGAEALVRGASRLASAVGISPLVIGLTVVAYGTSAPELVVSVTAGLAGQADIALGNVVGSNIFNVLFILGLSALIAPLVVSQQLVRLDVPLMIAVSLLALLISLDGRIGRIEGILCVAGIIIYTLFLIRHSRKAGQGVSNHQQDQPRTSATVLYIVGGLGLLVLGASWLVESAVTIAQLLGVSELIIGLTIVAAGTSLPEVATSIVATIRGERDIAVGNIVGSNIFNILMVLGLSGVVAPDGIYVSPAALHFDIPIMIAVAVACLPIFFTGQVIARWEGAVFLGYYIAYTLYLVLAAAEHAALAIFSAAMAWFVIPLTVLTLLLITLRAIRSSRQGTIP
ncbi:MAG: calcium/sodium antiporter [Truepera sp.]|nr:calcium/sodium antiporter [Truepera sp.]